ncbi:extracellular solute-binding protein [Paenibacillus lemnae]|uniref:Extracellular solute-binding protein n=1 Tax=Paenibacillus lemnae TaxID=1330551 RepID=A0A848M1Y9_PAELE|nr:extracellular solute-binding protein [Paenibacillus lemnae]NMO94978.1 extracellular solute-binding protein [Paenibacillus lemnae]
MQKDFRKKLSWSTLMGLMLCVSLVLSACGGSNEGGNSNSSSSPEASSENGSDAAENGKLIVWGWDKGSHDKLMTEFSKNHPNIQVEYVEVSAKDYLKKIQTSIASGSELPDIIWAEAAQRGAIYELNVLEDLGAAPYNFDKSTLLDFEVPLLTNSKGQLVALDQQVAPGAVAYKRELAKQYLGTDDPDQLASMFQSWDDFAQKGKDVYDQSQGKVTMFASLMDAYTILSNQMTEPFVDGNKVNKAEMLDLFNKLQMLRDTNNEAKLSMWSPSWSASYSQDNVIFYPAANWSPEFVIKPNDKNSSGAWGLTVPPGGGFTYGGTSVGIWKDSKQKEAAWTYLKGTYGSEEGAEVSFKGMQAILPLKSVFDDTSKLASGPDEFFGGQDLNKFWVEKVFPSIKAKPVTKYDQDVYAASEIVLQTMAQDNNFDANQALEKWSEEMKKNHPELTIE